MSNKLSKKRVEWLLQLCEDGATMWKEGYTTKKVLDVLEKKYFPMARRTIQNYLYDKKLYAKLLKRKNELDGTK